MKGICHYLNYYFLITEYYRYVTIIIIIIIIIIITTNYSGYMPLFELSFLFLFFFFGLDLWWHLKNATIGPSFVFGWTYGRV